MEYFQLKPPTFLGRNNQAFESAIRSIRESGPFDQGACPAFPKLLFVFPEELKELANRLFLVLRNGVGPFSGVEPWFGMRLSKENVSRPPSFSVKGLNDSDTAAAYQSAIEAVLQSDSGFDGALVIHDRTPRTLLTNPYLSAKFSLMRLGIPTQIVTTDVLSDERTLQWSVANVGLGLFAKLGGQPWAVRSCLSDDTLVVGLNRALVTDKEDQTKKRFHGFATAFSHHGLFLGIRIFPAADDMRAYLAGLRSAVAQAIEGWHSVLGKSINLVIHLPKEPSKDERHAVEGAVSSVQGKSIHSSSIVRLNEARYVRLTDPTSREGLPPPGVLVRVENHRALLQLTGRKEDVIGGATEASPWAIRVISQMGNGPTLRDLCDHVFALSYMNWRGINAVATPVSVEYPRQIAELMARFSEGGFRVDDLRGQPILERPWFL